MRYDELTCGEIEHALRVTVVKTLEVHLGGEDNPQSPEKHWMHVADNGPDWAASCAPHSRIPLLRNELRKVKGSDFEVIVPLAGYKPAK